MSTPHAQGWDDGPGHHRRGNSTTVRAHTPAQARTHHGAHTWADVGLSPDTLAWHDEAACRHSDPDAFFPELEHPGSLPMVRRICGGCPVRTQCLDYALARPELVGIWGGLTTRERHRHRAANSREGAGREAA